MRENAQPLVEGEDYYMDGPYLVFTEAYHRKRGYCCQSGCRHCPWRGAEDAHSPTSENPDVGHPGIR
ncbi:MAG: DUF5522 domain-containing protein [Silvibacterium sp.]